MNHGVKYHYAPIGFLATLLSLIAADPPNLRATIAHWIGPSNGSWNTAANWDVNKVPNNSDGDSYDVVVASGSTLITLSQPATIHNLEFSSINTLNFSADLTVSGNLNWSGGTFNGPGKLTVFGMATHAGAGKLNLETHEAEFDGGFFQTAGEFRIDGTVFSSGSQLQIDGGELSGYGVIDTAHVNALLTPSPRKLQFKTLILGPDANIELAISGSDFDALQVDQELAINGTLLLGAGDGFDATQLSQSLEIISLTPGLTVVRGSFKNVAWGGLLAVRDGANEVGSFTVTQLPAGSGSVFLTGIPGAPYRMILAGDVTYPFRPLVLDPAAMVTDSETVNWAGGSVQADVVSGLDALHDALKIAPELNPAQMIQLDGETLSYGDIDFGTLEQPAPSVGISVRLNARATTSAIQALLRVIAFSNDRFDAAAVEAPDSPFPPRRILVKVIDAAQHSAVREITVDFPYAVQLSSEPQIAVIDPILASRKENPQGTGEEWNKIKFNVAAIFSDGSRISLPPTNVTVVSDCAPGVFTVTGGTSESIEGITRGAQGTCAVVFHAGEHLSAFSTVIITDSSLLHFLRWLVDALIAKTKTPISRQTAFDVPVPLSVATFHAATNLMIETLEGRRLTELYLNHSGELIANMATNLPLAFKAAQVALDFQSALSAFLYGNGQAVKINQSMITGLNGVLDQLVNQVGPELKAAIQTERTRFNGLQDFVGKDFSQWASLLGINNPSAPWLYLSSIARDGASVRLEANTTPGTISVWRAEQLTAWTRLSNVSVARDGYTTQIVDSNAPPGRVFYRLQLDTPGLTR